MAKLPDFSCKVDRNLDSGLNCAHELLKKKLQAPVAYFFGEENVILSVINKNMMT